MKVGFSTSSREMKEHRRILTCRAGALSFHEMADYASDI